VGKHFGEPGRCFVGLGHAIIRRREVEYISGHGGQKCEGLVMGSSIGVRYMGFGCRFGEGVEAGYNGVTGPWVQITILNQLLPRLLSSSFQSLPQYHSEWLG